MFTFTQEQLEGQIRLGGLRVDTSTSERLRSWQQSLELFRRYPLWGTGVTGGPFMDAMYPRVLTEAGLLGLAAFLFLLWSIFRTGLTAFHQAPDPFSRGVALGFLLGFLGLLVHAVGANTFLIVRIMEPFWLYVALVVKSLLLVQRKQSVEEGATVPVTPAGGAEEGSHGPPARMSGWIRPRKT
jgi:O-antigen ligase